MTSVVFSPIQAVSALEKGFFKSVKTVNALKFIRAYNKHFDSYSFGSFVNGLVIWWATMRLAYVKKPERLSQPE